MLNYSWILAGRRHCLHGDILFIYNSTHCQPSTFLTNNLMHILIKKNAHDTLSFFIFFQFALDGIIKNNESRWTWIRVDLFLFFSLSLSLIFYHKRPCIISRKYAKTWVGRPFKILSIMKHQDQYNSENNSSGSINYCTSLRFQYCWCTISWLKV